MVGLFSTSDTKGGADCNAGVGGLLRWEKLGLVVILG
jgi:hypothetical protein